jgi:hypothetical protein
MLARNRKELVGLFFPEFVFGLKLSQSGVPPFQILVCAQQLVL